MTVTELKNEILSLGISEEYYSILLGGLPNEKLCIVKENMWEVYYSERGQKTGLRTFSTEEEACDYFLRKIKRYSR